MPRGAYSPGICSLRNGLTVLPNSSEGILTRRGLISSSLRFLSQLSFKGCAWVRGLASRDNLKDEGVKAEAPAVAVAVVEVAAVDVEAWR